MRNRRRAISAAVVAAAAIGTMVVTATNASATPGNCTLHATSSPVTALCTTGTGEYMVDVVMYRDGVGQQAVNSPWTPIGQVASVNVPWTIQNAWLLFQ